MDWTLGGVYLKETFVTFYRQCEQVGVANETELKPIYLNRMAAGRANIFLASIFCYFLCISLVFIHLLLTFRDCTFRI